MHLEVSDLHKQFATPKGAVVALKGVNLYVDDGEFVCVVGASGSGKSTLLRLIAGLEVPTAGWIEVDSERVTGPGADRGMVFQDYTLYPWMTVQKNVEFGLKLQGVEKSVRREQASYFLEMVGLTQFAQALPKQLSGGMKQRVAIARALANQPKVLLLDEPFAAVDQTTEAHLLSLIDRWQDEGRAVVLVVHDLSSVLDHCDNALLLGNGEAYHGSVDTILTPERLVAQNYLSKSQASWMFRASRDEAAHV